MKKLSVILVLLVTFLSASVLMTSCKKDQNSSGVNKPNVSLKTNTGLINRKKTDTITPPKVTIATSSAITTKKDTITPPKKN